jgi:signal transduction histidine kinase
MLQLQREKERAMQETVTRLERIGELKDEMIFIASHDLRTPVSIIRSNLSTIRDGYAGKVNKEAMGHIDAAYRSADRLRILLEDMLETSSIEHKDQVTLKPVRIEEIIRAVVEAHAREAKHMKIKYPHKPYAAPPVLADEHLLRRAIENLFLNAIKFTKRGSITITVVQEGNRVLCTIADTGIGISPEAQEQLFTKFYRASNAVDSDVRGSGLGLYITKQIVQRLRGEIKVTSVLNKGSTFMISLPAAAS